MVGIGVPARNLVAVVLSDGAYGIAGGQQLSAAPRFAAVAQALGGIAGLRVNRDSDLRRALGELERPSLPGQSQGRYQQ